MFELFNKGIKYVFGGYSKNSDIRFESTSGGAFSLIADVYCDENYVIFGAEADGLDVFHSYITDICDISKYRKSKYSQSKMGSCYEDCMKFLKSGKKVLFSGTPCQIAGLKLFLNMTNTDMTKLLTVEVICEGVPSPLYIRKYEESLFIKFGRKVEKLDYRYTGKSYFNYGKWDFQVMKTKLVNDDREIILDRWFNPFWWIWINHLMSRPVCYKCPFAKQDRVADITLGDLWGIHLFCPELYENNMGSSLIVSNTDKGMSVVKKAQKKMYGHKLNFEDALKYQSPMRNHISMNESRYEFMEDLKSNMTYEKINKKWVKMPSLKLLWQKYIWGNRQKIEFWKLTKGKYKIR